MSCGNCGNINCGGCSGCPGNYVNVPCSPVGVTINPCVPACGATPCNNVLPGTPTPYYAQSGQCAEDHTQTLIQNWFSAAICVTYGFNIPACGLTAILIFSNVAKLVVGSYLWHPTYGYFKILSFDFTNGQVVVLNECQEDNAAAGTFIPACTCFIVTPTPVDVTLVGAVCLTVDFTAPAIGACIDITVTNVNGLLPDGLVAIGSGIYNLTAVLSPTIITICNDGQGITPGTSVIAFDADGNYQYCLSVLGTNPCARPTVEDGVVLVCNDGVSSPLEGFNDGDFLKLVTEADNMVAFAPVVVNDVQLADATPFSGNVASGGGTASVTTAAITANNPSSSRNQEVVYFVETYIETAASDVDIVDAPGPIELSISINGGAYGAVRTYLVETVPGFTGIKIEKLSWTYFNKAVNVPSGTYSVQAKAVYTNNNAANINISTLQLRLLVEAFNV